MDTLKSLVISKGVSHTSHVTVGPVMGEVSTVSARILLEMDTSANLEAIVICKENGKDMKTGVCVCLEANIPSVIQIDGLQPSHTYNVVFLSTGEGKVITRRNGEVAEAVVRTLPSEKEKMKFAFVSCNKYSFEYPGEIFQDPVCQWTQLLTHINEEDDVRLLIGLGDQVYSDADRAEASTPEEILVSTSDSAYITARKILIEYDPVTGDPINAPPEKWAKQRDTIVDLYRTTYRKTYNYPPERKVRMKMGCLNLADDHETRDDIGIQDADHEKDSLEHFLADIAREVYQEYQRNLRLSDRDREYTARDFGETRMLLLDAISGRTTEYDPALGARYFTVDHTKWIKQMLEDDTKKMLILCLPQPLFFFTRDIEDLGENIINDLGGRLNSHEFGEECDNFVSMIVKWKNEVPGRHLVILSGDIHLSIPTYIFTHGDRERIVAFQATSSGIKNGMSWSEAGAFQTGLSLNNTLKENVNGLGYYHGDCTTWCNYGVLSVPSSGSDYAQTNVKIFSQDKKYPKFHLSHDIGSQVP